jgi:hypothetical protein
MARARHQHSAVTGDGEGRVSVERAMGCPEPGALHAFFERHDSGSERETIGRHLESCAACLADLPAPLIDRAKVGRQPRRQLALAARHRMDGLANLRRRLILERAGTRAAARRLGTSYYLSTVPHSLSAAYSALASRSASIAFPHTTGATISAACRLPAIPAMGRSCRRPQAASMGARRRAGWRWRRAC